MSVQIHHKKFQLVAMHELLTLLEQERAAAAASQLEFEKAVLDRLEQIARAGTYHLSITTAQQEKLDRVTLDFLAFRELVEGRTLRGRMRRLWAWLLTFGGHRT